MIATYQVLSCDSCKIPFLIRDGCIQFKWQLLRHSLQTLAQVYITEPKHIDEVVLCYRFKIKIDYLSCKNIAEANLEVTWGVKNCRVSKMNYHAIERQESVKNQINRMSFSCVLIKFHRAFVSPFFRMQTTKKLLKKCRSKRRKISLLNFTYKTRPQERKRNTFN